MKVGNITWTSINTFNDPNVSRKLSQTVHIVFVTLDRDGAN